MAGIDDLANITINFGDVPISPAGFGTELLLATVSPEQAGNFPGGALTVELAPSTFKSTLALLGFSSSDLAWVLCDDHFAQQRKPQRQLLGRRQAPVAQVERYEVTAQADGFYAVVINGTSTTQVDGTGKTIEQIRDELVGNVNDVGFTEPVSAAAGAPGFFDVTADNAGIPFIASATSPSSVLEHEPFTANVGIGEDLTAIKAETSDWYLLSGDWRTTPEILLAAELTEADDRIYLAQTSDVAAQIVGNTTDVGSQLAQLGYLRTSAWYSDNDAQGLADAIAGLMLPSTPGSETWANKTLASVSGIIPTSTALATKNYSWLERYIALAPPNGIAATSQGKVASGTYLDVIRGRDFVKQQLQIALVRLLLTNPVVRYTDQGGDQARGTIKTELERIAEITSSGAGAENGFLLPNTIKVATISRAQQSVGDKTHRTWSGLTFSFTLQGAIHRFDVQGTINN